LTVLDGMERDAALADAREREGALASADDGSGATIQSALEAALGMSGFRLPSDEVVLAHGMALSRLALEAADRAVREVLEGTRIPGPVPLPWTHDTTQPGAPGSGPTLQETFKAFKEHLERKGRLARTIVAYEPLYKILCEIVGEHRPIRAISRADCRAVLSLLERLPPNAAKRFPGKTFKQIAAIASEKELAPLSAKTTNNLLNSLSAIFRFAVDEEFCDRNPAKGLNVADARGDREKRDPFTVDALKAIFAAPLFTGCKDDGNGYSTPGTKHPRRGRFWIPLIALFTGMRLNEVCQLATADVEVIGDVPVIRVRDDADWQRLKTSAARRLIPLHPELQRIGFMAHVEGQRRKKEARLFPELPLGHNGYLSDPFQKFFKRFLRDAGAKTARTSFHSFRHTFTDALRDAGVPEDRRRELLGWAGKGMEATYGAGHAAATLAPEVAKVTYAGLDLAHLYRE
jgi:integrase